MTLEQARSRLRAATTDEERREAIFATFRSIDLALDDLLEQSAGTGTPAKYARVALTRIHEKAR